MEQEFWSDGIRWWNKADVIATDQHSDGINEPAQSWLSELMVNHKAVRWYGIDRNPGSVS